MAPKTSAIRKNNWVNIIFFAVTTLVGLIGTPLYIYKFGVTGSEIALLVFFVVVTPLSITDALIMHQHRYYLLWAIYVDTDLDPNSIKIGRSVT